MRIGECLIADYGKSQEEIYQGLAEQFNLPFLASLSDRINEKLLREYPAELFKQGRCFPLEADEEIFKVAVGDPLELDIVMDAQMAAGMPVDVSLTTPAEMERCREKYFGDATNLTHSADSISREYQLRPQDGEDTLSVEEIKRRTDPEIR